MSDMRLNSLSLTEFVKVEQRYARAADVQRDSTRHESLPPFRFTEKSLSVLRAMVREGKEAGGSATAIVGPYGAGKSLFTVVTMALLEGGEPDSWTTEALEALRRADPVLAGRVDEVRAGGGYVSLAIEATPDGIARPLLSAVKGQLSALGKRSTLSRQLSAMLRQDRVESIPTFIEEVARAAADSGALALMIVIDEFGRVLEGDPASSTKALALVQELAELAERTSKPRIDLVLTVHQNFQDYTTPLSRGRKAEWAKVQGRFQQVPYLPSVTDSYPALADAITVSSEIGAQVARWVRDSWDACEPILGSADRQALAPYVGRLWPLHPLTALLLPRLAIAIGQNERSTYAFISSGDPRALRSWVAQQRLPDDLDRLPSFALDRLFDYFAANEFGSGLPRRARQVLAQARAALEQLADASGEQTRIVKVAAALALARDQCDLRATHAVIQAALPEMPPPQLHDALQQLVEQRILLLRPHSGEYLVNPGSGIDVDELIDKAVREVAGAASLRREVENAISLEPVIAHRLTFEKGTTRSFAREAVLPDGLQVEDADPSQTSWQLARAGADGRIRYVLAVDEVQLAAAQAVASRLSGPTNVIVVPAEPLSGLPEAAIELAALRRMQSATDGLDAVARHELSARVEESTAALLRLLAPLIEPRTAAWWAGEQSPSIPANQREMQSLLSRLAASAFDRSPRLHNELINRRELSSAAVVAAKLVVRRLLAGSFEEGLGFSGNGPEVSIVKALLDNPGILRHDARRNSWVLGQPVDVEWRAVWAAGEQFLEDGLRRPVAVSELWDVWSAPPFGIRAGVLPLLTWALLAANQAQLCLFERGTYLHSWSEELYDRVARWPEDFTVRRLPANGSGSTVVSALLDALPNVNAVDRPADVQLNVFLSALFDWYAKLPPYAKRTQTVSEQARHLRAVLNRTKDPVALVLNEIPRSLGFADLQGPLPDELVASFGRATAELDSAYPALLRRITAQQALSLGLGEQASTVEVRAQFAQLQRGLGDYTLRPKSAALLLRACNSTLSDEHWCESIAAAVVGTPPKAWTDSDVHAFEANVGPLLLEIQEGFDTRVRLGGAEETLGLASRIALFKHGRSVADVVARRPLSAQGERVANQLRSALEVAISELPPVEHPALAARLIELLLSNASESEGTS